MIVRLCWFVWYRGGTYGGVCIQIVKVYVCMFHISCIAARLCMCFPIFSNFVSTLCLCVHPVRVTWGRGVIYMLVCVFDCPTNDVWWSGASRSPVYVCCSYIIP